ncbi:ATP-binding protein [Bradyrhizobium sp. SYSU BS000235]|uniref:ATP-binding protein n=1 Tax=Bradyrhizobium sp. SYSU BS000235 TaxID=3411332 RepID=UPI003C750415
MTDDQHTRGNSGGYDSLSGEELISRLREAEETLEAIRVGEVDAVVIAGANGQQVYALENADRPYRVLVEQMQEGAVTLSEDGLILYCNKRFATIVGEAHDSIIGENVLKFFDAGQRADLLNLIGAIVRPSAAGEFTIIDKSGLDIPVNISLIDLKVESGMPRMVCAIVTDLTFNRLRSRELGVANERLATEIVERRKTEENLQLTLDAAEMGIWELDLTNNQIRCSSRHDLIFGNETHFAFFDLELLTQCFVPEDRAKVTDAFVRAKSIGTIEFEHRIRRASDGAVRWVSVKGRTYYDGPSPMRVTGVTADVTKRREVDEQLRQAQKMEAVGQLTGGIAHDFNNLLMIIGGSLDMLGRRIADDARISNLLDAARQAVGRGAKLNQQLLAFSRRQDLRMEIVQVNDLVSTFEHLLDRAVGETVKLEFVRDPDLWECRTDPHQLETAILNLVINARDAMPEGGRLIIKTSNREADQTLSAQWGASAGDYVVVSVEDTGIGMSPEILNHIFEPFFTTKDIGKGTGLGLSQVYGFAKQSGGFVTVASTPGKGTLIEVFLKRSREARSAIHPTSAMSPETGTGIVLVVEDDAAVRATTSGMLDDLGYLVVSADTGNAALKIVQDNSAIDLVFSDVVMPDGMNGVELARRITSLRPGMPVLLTSGYTAQRALPEMPAGGGLALLKKPFTQAELSIAIRDIMATSAENEPT